LELLSQASLIDRDELLRIIAEAEQEAEGELIESVEPKPLPVAQSGATFPSVLLISDGLNPNLAIANEVWKGPARSGRGHFV
jgi:hypothetical protein